MTLAELLATRQFVMADLFTITLAPSGQTLTFTCADKPIYWGGVYYDAYGLQIEGLRFKKAVGLGVDEQSVVIRADSGMRINNAAWFDAIAGGLLDDAGLKRERVFMADWNAQPVGSLVLFDGMVSTIDSLTSVECQLKVKSYLNLLNQPMPRNSWQATCLHTLFDSGCTLANSAWRASGVVGAGSSDNTIEWTNSATAGYYWQGTVLFTSGENAGLLRTIKLATGSQLILTLPLPFAPATGDTFDAFPGCDKTLPTCQSRFNNLANMRAFPFVPVPQVAL